MAGTPPPDQDHRSIDAGFTLIEVMVVILVIGVLLAVGIPTYRGARARAQDSSAQSSLHNGFVAASIVFVDELDFLEADSAGMAASEPGLAYVDSPAPSSDDAELSVASIGGGATWGAAVRSDSGTCFYIRTNGTGSITYGSSDTLACTGAVALTTTGNGWTTIGGVGLTGLEGGFSSDTSIGGYWNTHGAGAFIGDEWEVVSGSVDAQVQHSSSFDFGVEGQFIDLNGGSAGHIRRSVTVIPDTAYELTFDLGENVYGGSAVKRMEVIWNGVVVATLDVDVPALQLQQISLTLPAVSGTEGVLEFKSLLPSAYGPILGNPQLTPAG
ncbi:MAG: prepilin-type N-terminal cleavage/methylation domain-containing protein [Actinomycetota bacterium]